MDYSNRFHPQNQLVNSGLSRYRSAPSSFLESLVNNSNINGNDEDFRYFRSISPEPDNFVPEYMLPSNNFGESDARRHQFEGNTVKQEDTTDISITQQQSNNNNGYTNGNGSSSQHMIYQSMQIQENDNLFGAANSVGNTRNGINLVRQNSSPAGLFSNLGVDNGIIFFYVFPLKLVNCFEFFCLLKTQVFLQLPNQLKFFLSFPISFLL